MVEPDAYARPALCPAGRRDTQLACSHSTARLPLRRAIEVLQARDGADAAALGDLLTEWMRLDAALGTLDHRRYAAETRLADAVEQDVRNHFGNKVLNAVIPRNVRVSEAPSYGQSVMTYDPGSRGATSYFEAALEIAMRGVNTGGTA